MLRSTSRFAVLVSLAAALGALGCGDTTSDASGGAGGSKGGAGGTGGIGGASTTSSGGAGGSTASVTTGSGGALPNCVNAIPIDDPAMITGNTSNATNDLTGSCEDGDAPELVYKFIPANTGALHVDLNSAADMGIYILTDCEDPRSEIGCSDKNSGGKQELLDATATAGVPLYIVVDGYSDGEKGPFSLSVQSLAPNCGDGIIEPPETCDPPDGVECGPACTNLPEICNDGVDNDKDNLIDCEDPDCVTDPACPLGTICSSAPNLVASIQGDTSTGTRDFRGSCVGGNGSPEQVYQFNAVKGGILSLTLQSDTNLGFYVRTTCTDNTTELICEDRNFGGADETGTVVLTTGQTARIFVDSSDPDEAGPFTLNSIFTMANEVEPNNAPAQSNAYVEPFVGAISPAGDVDVVRISVPGPSSSLLAEVDDIGNGDCANFVIDSELDILGPDGSTVIASNDDYLNNACSLVTASGLPGGTYYVRVSSSPKAPEGTFAYRLRVTAQ